MPYTPSPVLSTYSTHQLPLVYGLNLRPGSKSMGASSNSISQDAGMINLVPMKSEDGSMYAVSRMAVASTNSTTLVGASGGAIVRGMHVWEKTAGTIYYFVVVGTSVFTSTDGIAFTAVITLTNNLGTPVRFTEFIDDTNVKKLVMVDGIEGYVFTTNAAGTKITDVDFPTPHVPFPIFLDGYLFLAKADTGDIYNSDLNDPAIWTAGSFISSEMYPDNVVALLKISNYLVAVGTQSCEYLYDAANATASPLARIEGATLPFGTVLPNTIASNKDTATFVANNNDGQGIIVRLEGLKHSEISSTFVVPLLNARISSTTTSRDKVRAFYFRQSGELFYTLNFADGSTGTDAGSSPTFVYSFSTSLWTEFRHQVLGTDSFPVSFTAPITSNQLFTYIAGSVFGGSTAFFGILREGDSTVTATDTINGIASAAIYREIRTPSVSFGVMNIKFLNRLGIMMDNGKSNVGLLSVNIQWSDDDYATFNTAISVNVNPNNPTSVFNAYFPFITQLGAFRRRAFKISYSGNQFVRFYYAELDINKGQQ